MNGWIKLHRELMYKPIWFESSVEQKVILITLLLLANHTERQWEFEGIQYRAQPGEFVTSLRRIADQAGPNISIRNVRTALDRFEKYGFLTSKATNKNRLITIVNWANYQALDTEGDKPTDKQPTSNRQATDKQPTTNKNVRSKELKNERKDKIQYAEFVQMTEQEYNTIVERFGQTTADQAIQTLDDYKGASGKKYASDYRAILSWVIDKLKNKPQNKPPTNNKPKLVMIHQAPDKLTADELRELQETAKRLDSASNK